MAHQWTLKMQPNPKSGLKPRRGLGAPWLGVTPRGWGGACGLPACPPLRPSSAAAAAQAPSLDLEPRRVPPQKPRQLGVLSGSATRWQGARVATGVTPFSRRLHSDTISAVCAVGLPFCPPEGGRGRAALRAVRPRAAIPSAPAATRRLHRCSPPRRLRLCLRHRLRRLEDSSAGSHARCFFAWRPQRPPSPGATRARPVAAPEGGDLHVSKQPLMRSAAAAA